MVGNDWSPPIIPTPTARATARRALRFHQYSQNCQTASVHAERATVARHHHHHRHGLRQRPQRAAALRLLVRDHAAAARRDLGPLPHRVPRPHARAGGDLRELLLGCLRTRRGADRRLLGPLRTARRLRRRRRGRGRGYRCARLRQQLPDLAPGVRLLVGGVGLPLRQPGRLPLRRPRRGWPLRRLRPHLWSRPCDLRNSLARRRSGRGLPRRSLHAARAAARGARAIHRRRGRRPAATRAAASEDGGAHVVCAYDHRRTGRAASQPPSALHGAARCLRGDHLLLGDAAGATLPARGRSCDRALRALPRSRRARQRRGFADRTPRRRVARPAAHARRDAARGTRPRR